MTKQTSRDNLISEIKTLLSQYEKKELTADDGWYGRNYPEYRRANAVWLLGQGPIAKALRKHLLRKRLSEFWAKYFRVTEERFIEWREHTFTENPQCSKVLATAGRRCKGKTRPSAMVPNLFFIGITNRCKRHTRDLSEEERIEQLMWTMDCSLEQAKAMNSMSREEMSEFFGSALASLARNEL